MEKNMKDRVRELEAEIERYQQMIRDAEGALDSAEKELDEVLSAAASDGEPWDDGAGQNG